MEKTCSGDWKCCKYACPDGCYIGCTYAGYCTFQLPDDGIKTYADMTGRVKDDG